MSSFHELSEKKGILNPNYKRCFDFKLTKEMYFILRNKYLFFSKILKVTSLVQLFANKMLVSINKKTSCEDFNLLKDGYISLIQAIQYDYRTEIRKIKSQRWSVGLRL